MRPAVSSPLAAEEKPAAGRVYLETYGCQMNLVDSEIILAMLEERGWTRAGTPGEAEVILVNTCAVREHAEGRAIANIAQLRRYREGRPEVKIGVLGCLSTHAGETLARKLPFLDWVLGPDAYRQLPALLTAPRPEAPRVILDGSPRELYDDILPARREGVNAWVAISRGCDNHCTYCVVPNTRGGLRHRTLDSVLREVRRAVEEGFPQVTLLGQNVNSWREGELGFPDLLERVASVEGVRRVRFLTSHPKDCSPRLLEVMASGPPLCPELHLPVQAGADGVLRRMNRRYTADGYRALVDEARRRIGDLALSTDIIVGFPGESEEEFRATERLVEEIGYDEAFVYKYSPRPGTPAARLEDTVPEPVKVRRLMRINEIVRASGVHRRVEQVGRTLPVLVEGRSAKRGDESMGRTPAGHVVVFPGVAPVGSEVPVKLTRLSGFTLRGRAVEAESAVPADIRRPR